MNQFINALAGLCANQNRVFSWEAQDLFNFFRNSNGISRREIDFVDNRNDFQSSIDGGVCVGNGLRLNALRSVNNQNRAFTRLHGALHFIVKVHMPWRIDEVQHEFFIFVFMKYRDCRRFDRNAAFAFEIHVIEHLIVELTFGNRARPHQ